MIKIERYKQVYDFLKSPNLAKGISTHRYWGVFYYINDIHNGTGINKSWLYKHLPIMLEKGVVVAKTVPMYVYFNGRQRVRYVKVYKAGNWYGLLGMTYD